MFMIEKLFHLVRVGDLESGLGMSSHQDVTEDELILLLAKEATTALHLLVMLPDTQVLYNSMFFKDGANIRGADCGDTCLGYQLVWDTCRVISWITSCDVYGYILKTQIYPSL